MKKITLWTLTACLLCTTITIPSLAAKKLMDATTPALPSADAQRLLTRLDEINAMDKAPLTGTEKRKLRKEVRTIKKDLAQSHGGIYLSVGAIIIIVLLLILLL